MKYLYYPGCSLEGTAREYDLSTRALMTAVGAELLEIQDWTCCGASAAEATNATLALALPARNFALAAKMNAVYDILVPCSACYLNMKKVEQKVFKDPQTRQKINAVLNEDALELTQPFSVRHILDIISTDVGSAKIQSLVQKRLSNMIIAPYYGCQCLRPYAVFDDPEDPRSMEPLLEAVGAGLHPWKMGGKCCGASHMNTKMEVGIELVAAILRAAKGADAIVTVCPMCQMNLEAFQTKISRAKKDDLSITVLYLPQLLGLALGLSEKEVRLDLNLSVSDHFKKKIAQI